jgi:oligopeptide/dipeptide ABC transporter ATP-binding protein
MTPLLHVKDLRVYFMTPTGVARAVDGIDFAIRPSRTLGVVGESGCGKSAAARAILRLIEPPGWIESGEIVFRASDGLVDLLDLPQGGARLNAIRGAEIAMIFQEPMVALNPVLRIGEQICESLLIHRKMSRKEAKERAIAGLAAVGISAPHQRFDEYAHNLSGGMRQRAMIAMALICNPSLLIADEPTTALDVTIQAQVLDLMAGLRREFSGSIMFITHDLGVIAQTVDDVLVMYRGTIVESAPVREIFRAPLHPYTQGLLRCVPSIAARSSSRLATIEGSVPPPTEHLAGCAFAPRCAHALPKCRASVPAPAPVDATRSVACFLHHSIALESSRAA